eukprot:g3211.t1
MPGITAACTCSVDGRSGDADTRHREYSFTGCGAHVDYRLSLLLGGGYERTWCYVTSPPNCPGESPYIPEGFKTDNTLSEWEAQGAAWKECYDGYRCEAWWGSAEGTPEGDPVVLDAPLDWPDCCALCSSGGGGRDGTDDEQSPTSSACVGWSFDPSTGSCQRMSAVGSVSRDPSWGVNSTVHGYPGYFEPPLNDCWNRAGYDLCVNLSLIFVLFGVIGGCLGLLCIYIRMDSQSARTRLLREFLEDPQSSRLVKAACVEVTGQRFDFTSVKGIRRHASCFEGTFITQDGAQFVVPPAARRPGPTFSGPGRLVEHWMLHALFETDVDPLRSLAQAPRNLSTPVAAGRPLRARTSPSPLPSSGDLRSEYSRLSGMVGSRPLRQGVRVTRRPREQGGARFRFDCLLLVGGGACTEPPGRKVLLVGILGEDRITRINLEMGLGRPHSAASALRRCDCGFILLFVATVLLVLMCVSLLTNKAAQHMAAWTFHGNSKVGAIFGLVLCGWVPPSVAAWVRHRNRELQRLVEGFPPADPDSDRARR